MLIISFILRLKKNEGAEVNQPRLSCNSSGVSGHPSNAAKTAPAPTDGPTDALKTGSASGVVPTDAYKKDSANSGPPTAAAQRTDTARRSLAFTDQSAEPSQAYKTING